MLRQIRNPRDHIIPPLTLKIAFALAAVVFLAATTKVALFFSSEFNRAGTFGSHGEIETGSAFGVNIGETADRARAILARGGLLRDRSFGGSCLAHDYEEKREAMELWAGRDSQRGTLCLGFRDDRVTSITWSSGQEFP